MTFFDTVERIYKGKDWWYETPKLLYALACLTKPFSVVEVGTYYGLAACWMGKAMQDNNDGKLYCIENWALGGDETKEFWENSLMECGVRDWVELVEGDSREVKWPDSVDMAYIDGDHSYEACLFDTMKAFDLGAKCIILDDIDSEPGPRKVADMILTSQDFKEFNKIEIHKHMGILIAML